jgi:dCMP deaminase
MRKDYIKWDEYFMGLAKLSAERSKDPNTQVGACIVNEAHKVVALGYNGMPRGVKDSDMPWEREGDFLDTKYAYVCHSELNAILNSVANTEGCTIYVTLFPCNECA